MDEELTPTADGQLADAGVLRTRLSPPNRSIDTGLHVLGDRQNSDGLLYVPAGYSSNVPAPLVVALHGSDGDAHSGIAPFLPWADAAHTVIVALKSRGATWDMILGEYGPDIMTLDRALGHTFDSCSVDPYRIAIAGFSDGATYAIAVGLENSGLFTHVIALSPGFAAPAPQSVMPLIYVSHGTDDAVLPIDVCSRSIVSRLRRAGYTVRFREFQSGHTVPASVAREAVDWFVSLAGSPPAR